MTSSLEKKRLRDIERLQHRQLAEEKERLERTQRRLDEELNEALKYVRSIFPPPTDIPFKIDWFYEPSAELGGDSFGYHLIDEEHFAVYLLDVCGHGVGPALLSVTAINQIRSGSIPNVDMKDPGAVLAALSNIYLMSKQNDMYFTLWYGVYHIPSRTMRHASGGQFGGRRRPRGVQHRREPCGADCRPIRSSRESCAPRRGVVVRPGPSAPGGPRLQQGQ